VGYTFADAFTYIDEALARGLDIDEFAPRLSFFISCGPEFLAEAAKFRATRRLWARLMKERYNPKDKNSLRIRMTSATGGAYFQAIEPLNNLAYDEAYAIPTEETARLGLRTVQILAEETDLARTVDPLAGSYYIENLTDYIEQEVLKYLHQIEDAGGAAAAVESGFMRRELDKMFEIQHGKRLSGEIPVVGVNKYVHEGGAHSARTAEGSPLAARRCRGQEAAEKDPPSSPARGEPYPPLHRGRQGLRHLGGDHQRAQGGVRGVRGTQVHFLSSHRRGATAGGCRQQSAS